MPLGPHLCSVCKKIYVHTDFLPAVCPYCYGKSPPNGRTLGGFNFIKIGLDYPDADQPTVVEGK